ncbi:MAG: zf-HC2 domain-containing protein [Nitrospirota bacterium]
MDDLDKTLRDFIKKNHPLYASGEYGDCIAEEHFADYLNNLLPPREKEQVENHLDQCNDCFQKSIMLSKVIDEMKNSDLPDLPDEIMQRARTLVKEPQSGEIIEVVLEFGRNIINIIKDTARICSIPEPAVLSTRDSSKSENLPYTARLRKKFREINAEVFLERTGGNECAIEIIMSEQESEELLDDIRINLISGKKELASYLTVKGSVSFRNLRFDKYVLKIYRGKDPIGSIKLKLSSIS